MLAGGRQRRHAGGLRSSARPTTSTSPPRSASRSPRTSRRSASSIAHVAGHGREALFDAEHFFDGWKANPDYALACLKAALDAGARWIVLCDTNGGTLPARGRRRSPGRWSRPAFPASRLGIHAHDDTGNAVANSLAAVDAGARQVQGTLNGLGERCGNANLVS